MIGPFMHQWQSGRDRLHLPPPADLTHLRMGTGTHRCHARNPPQRMGTGTDATGGAMP